MLQVADDRHLLLLLQLLQPHSPSTERRLTGRVQSCHHCSKMLFLQDTMGRKK
jgi:hypothetical protein